MGFDGLEPDDKIKSLICDYGVGAIVLFKRNIKDAHQLQQLCSALQNAAKRANHQRPLLIGIDQENGLVTRISPPVASQLPGPMTLAATATPGYAHQVGLATGETLRYFGINMNYAPIGDVNNEPLNRVIGVRSPSDDPQIVAEFASQCARGLREANVVPCIKHFPGHGDTAVDSHYGLPVINKTRAELERVELVPFRRAAAEGIEMVMTAHIALPQLGDDLPATLSPRALGILRNDMKYDGVIMTDCLEMDGIRATYGTIEGAVTSLKAGADNVMICHTYEQQSGAIDRVCQAIEAGELSQAQIDLSIKRLEKLKDRFTNWDTALARQPLADLEALNTKTEKLARRIYADATTVVRSAAGRLPLPRGGKTMFLFPGGDIPQGGAVDGEGDGGGDFQTGAQAQPNSRSFGDVLRRYNPDVVDIRFQHDDLSAEQWREIDSAQHIILTTYNASESRYQRELGLRLGKRCTSKLVTIACCNPYDFCNDAEIETYLTTYEPTVEAFSSAADIIYGKDSPRGRLPITI